MDRPAGQVSFPKRSVNPKEPHVKTLHSNAISDVFCLSFVVSDQKVESVVDILGSVEVSSGKQCSKIE